MLELKEIIKEYPTGDQPVRALKGVSLKFRKSEFVSILGPSGCGKTSLLNIIGGLDQYTSGDLLINGKSTKDFKDRDWDTYRNHSIGFVFQSYNLIAHQTVLQNVEIALTVSGVTKAERKERAIEALKQVGLADQLAKRPNQLSGGQMQRVAIARALVNNPDIILADEPTGALDTETGIQIMELLKNVAKDRLVIMVTHNPELAHEYSTRIIEMLDGKVMTDSQPLKEIVTTETVNSDKKPSMSFFTAFMLSLKNLFTKKGRTTLTAFAGSIGIMGIALILAVSNGTSEYIESVQEDALSSYPLSIEKTSVDMTTLMETFMNIGKTKVVHDQEAVYKKTAVYDMVSALNNLESSENDLKSFKSFLEKELKANDENEFVQAVTGVQYSYDLGLNIYTKNVDGEITKSDTQELLQSLMAEHMGKEVSSLSPMSGETPFKGMESLQSSVGSIGIGSVNLWQEMLPGKNGEPVNKVLKKQYDVVYGTWPKSYNEIVLILDKNNELDDLTLYALGLEPKENMDAIMDAAVNGTKVEKNESKWSYGEIINGDYRVILNADSYRYDDQTGFYVDLKQTEAGLKYLYDDALTLKVTGIIRPNENSQSTILSGAIGYTSGLTKYIVEKSQNTSIIQAQKNEKTIDILSGLPFKENTTELSTSQKAAQFQDYFGHLDASKKAEAFIQMKSIPSKEYLEKTVNEMVDSYQREEMEAMMKEGLSKSISIEPEELEAYLSDMGVEELNEMFSMMIEEQVKTQYAREAQMTFATSDPNQLATMFDQELEQLTDKEMDRYYDEMMTFSENSYEENLAQMGDVDLDSPKTVHIYASSFSNKEVIEEAIKEYNKGKPELSQIKYTDYLGIMMSSITSIINAITYVLLAFVAISLVVSSIMIGVITLISVQERTKEIGILRAMGASKADVSSMFNAETMIIGFSSGLLGVIVTYLLCIPINLILHQTTGIATINASLPLNAAIILVLISVALSVIAGFIPSRSAAKKDPVVALRTE